MSKGIYCIRNSMTGERYIGSSVNIEARWLIHKTQLNRKCHHSHKLQAAWSKYGERNFTFEIIEEIVDRENKTLAQREQYWLDQHNSYRNGYNSTPIASRPHTLTDEERGLRDELIRYGLYEPRYVQQIKAQNPLNYDLEEQKRWELKFAELCKQRRRYVLLGWLFFIVITVSYFVIVPLYAPSISILFPIVIWPIIGLSLTIGTAKKSEWENMKKVEPKAIAVHEQNNLIQAERKKCKRYRLPRGKWY
ncbi:MAG TPA: GIY-YIG nuclease family protein [Pyrinomonadaceae bacterium]|nr:GIY-YIG nuclease family protein [Pyrinomonadaceae bacterium]